MNLNEKQKKFCREYKVDLNQTQAAIRAGYSKKTAYAIGNKLLKKVEIQNYLSALIKKQEERTEITADRVLRELALLAFADVTDYAEIDVAPSTLIPGAFQQSIKIKNTADMPKDRIRAISSIKEGQVGIEVKLHDKVKALELIGKHLAMFTDKMIVSEEKVIFEGEGDLED